VTKNRSETVQDWVSYHRICAEPCFGSEMTIVSYETWHIQGDYLNSIDSEIQTALILKWHDAVEILEIPVLVVFYLLKDIQQWYNPGNAFRHQIFAPVFVFRYLADSKRGCVFGEHWYPKDWGNHCITFTQVRECFHRLKNVLMALEMFSGNGKYYCMSWKHFHRSENPILHSEKCFPSIEEYYCMSQKHSHSSRNIIYSGGMFSRIEKCFPPIGEYYCKSWKHSHTSKNIPIYWKTFLNLWDNSHKPKNLFRHVKNILRTEKYYYAT